MHFIGSASLWEPRSSSTRSLLPPLVTEEETEASLHIFPGISLMPLGADGLIIPGSEVIRAQMKELLMVREGRLEVDVDSSGRGPETGSEPGTVKEMGLV